MAIDLSGVGTTVPTPLAIGTTDDVNVATSREVAPPSIGVTAKMAPILEAGIDLVERVLCLTSLAILLLLLLLAWFEGGDRSEATDAYGRAVTEALSVRSSVGSNGVELLVAELRRASSDPSWALSRVELADAAATLKTLVSAYAPTDAQKDDLARCIPLPAATDANRSSLLSQCADTISSLVPSENDISTRVKLLEEIQKQANEEYQAFRTFWMQVSQMILLNIFFPLLTALLGYVFGTQQAANP